MKAVRIRQFGGPEVMCHEDTPAPQPQTGQVLVKVEAAGVNYIDTYQRSGLYPVPLPATLGLEAAGTVVETAAGVDRFQPGDRVAYTNVPGAYAELAAVPQQQLVRLPDACSFDQGAAAMLQGCTAHYLCRSIWPVKAGDRCLVHAAAGGVGLLLVQMIKRLGGFVIGTVSTEAKAALARQAGADAVILYTEQDFVVEVKRITDDDGVQVAYDSVGRHTFEKSLDCLARRGMMVLYGNASGPVTECNPATLASRGSLFLTRPTLFDYLATRKELEWRSGEVLAWIVAGELQLRLEHCYPLAAAQQAHQDLEARKTTGKIILKP